MAIGSREQIVEKWKAVIRVGNMGVKSTNVVVGFLKNPDDEHRKEVGLYSSHGDLAEGTMIRLGELDVSAAADFRGQLRGILVEYRVECSATGFGQTAGTPWTGAS